MVAGAISIVFRSIDVAVTVTITIVLLNIMDATARRSGGGAWCLAVPAVIVFSLCVIVFSLCVISTLGVGGVRG